MALVKRRIMSRARIAAFMADEADGKNQNSHGIMTMRQVSADLMLHLIADEKEVKIYNDRNMGGMVVEFDNGEA